MSGAPVVATKPLTSVSVVETVGPTDTILLTQNGQTVQAAQTAVVGGEPFNAQPAFVGTPTPYLGGLITSGGVEYLTTLAQMANAASVSAINVRGFGAKGDGVTNDTAAINAALASVGGIGGIVYFPDGVYYINAPLFYKSGTRIVFSPGAYILPAALGAFAPTTITTTYGAAPGSYLIFANANFQSASITDADVTFDGARVLPSTPWNGHFIFARKLRNLQVLRGRAKYVADLVAALACQDALVEGCYADTCSNCAYDFWEGPTNVTVRGNVATGCGASIQFNGTDTTNTANLLATGLLVEGNHIYLSGIGGVFVAPLNAGSTCANIKIRDNLFFQGDTAGGPGTWGGVVVERATNVDVVGNTFDHIGASATPIIVTQEDGVECGYVTVADNTISNSTIGSGAGYIGVYGRNARIRGNRSINSTAQIAISVSDQTSVIEANFLSGVTYAVSNNTELGVATTPAMQVDADSAAGQWHFYQGVKTDGALQQGTMAATATGANAASAFVISKAYTDFNVVASGAGGVMPAVVGTEYVVWNTGANALTIYPPSGWAIDGASSLSIAVNAKARLIAPFNGLFKQA